MTNRFAVAMYRHLKTAIGGDKEFKELLLEGYVVIKLCFQTVDAYVDCLSEDDALPADLDGQSQGDGDVEQEVAACAWLHVSLVYRKPWRVTPVLLRFHSHDELLQETWLQVCAGYRSFDSLCG